MIIFTEYSPAAGPEAGQQPGRDRHFTCEKGSGLPGTGLAKAEASFEISLDVLVQPVKLKAPPSIAGKRCLLLRSRWLHSRLDFHTLWNPPRVRLTLVNGLPQDNKTESGAASPVRNL